MRRLASELPQGMAGSLPPSRPAAVPEQGRRKRGQDRNAYRIGAERRSVCPETILTSVVRIEPRLGSGHAISRDDRSGGRSAKRATPPVLLPGSEVMMTQSVTVASGAVADHFDPDSLEVLRPRVPGLDVH